MSPVGGVGINVAIQDAVAAANLLWAPLRRGRLSTRDLAAVQREREFSVRLIQALQTMIQRWLLEPVLESTKPPAVPVAARVLARLPVVRDLPARLMAFGVRRPHVRSPLAAAGRGHMTPTLARS
jgi:2-polyprenyl-6-methoxyphenol hydroxylase-like FAD-dependent oxidoreductase